MSLSYLFFIVLGVLAIASAIVTIAHKNPIVSAMSLVLHFFMLAGLYLTLNAQFLAVIQVLVYAGAIMVLVVFVIMLLNLSDEAQLKEKLNFRKIIAAFFALGLITQFTTMYMGVSSKNAFLPPQSIEAGKAQSIGKELFSHYLVPFEAISLLLIVAIIGAIVLSKRRYE